MSGRFAQDGVVAMPKTYVQPVEGARYRWLAFVKFCECRFESGRASVLIVATRKCPIAQSYDADVRRRKVLGKELLDWAEPLARARSDWVVSKIRPVSL